MSLLIWGYISPHLNQELNYIEEHKTILQKCIIILYIYIYIYQYNNKKKLYHIMVGDFVSVIMIITSLSESEFGQHTYIHITYMI